MTTTQTTATPFSQEYTFFSDAGHGWLQVPHIIVAKLGLLDQVSRYSYMSKDRHWVYLEEDCDATKFMQAAVAAGWDITHKEKCCDSECFIRGLERFSN